MSGIGEQTTSMEEAQHARTTPEQPGDNQASVDDVQTKLVVGHNKLVKNQEILSQNYTSLKDRMEDVEEQTDEITIWSNAHNQRYEESAQAVEEEITALKEMIKSNEKRDNERLQALAEEIIALKDTIKSNEKRSNEKLQAAEEMNVALENRVRQVEELFNLPREHIRSSARNVPRTQVEPPLRSASSIGSDNIELIPTGRGRSSDEDPPSGDLQIRGYDAHLDSYFELDADTMNRARQGLAEARRRMPEEDLNATNVWSCIRQRSRKRGSRYSEGPWEAPYAPACYDCVASSNLCMHFVEEGIIVCALSPGSGQDNNAPYKTSFLPEIRGRKRAKTSRSL